MKRALITGIAGFAGSHLADLLLQKGFEVYGYYLSSYYLTNLDHIRTKIELLPVDTLDSGQVSTTISRINPDYVFHLAASSSPAQSFKDPVGTLQNNIFGEINILDALVRIRSKARILIIGSAEEYGLVEKKYFPLDEEAPLKPASPYAVSKVAQDFLGYQYFLHEKLHIVRVRPFNHIGPRQSKAFVVPAFAAQIAEIEKKGEGVIEVGNLNSLRDFTDVRDMVNAYLLALLAGKPGEVYNIGSGKLVKISELLKTLISFSDAKIKVKIDKTRCAPVEIKSISCNNLKFKEATGWEPKIPLKTTLFDTMKYEREQAQIH